jgi:hypothetical protein
LKILAIAARGLDEAIGVCRRRAPQIAADVSRQFNVTARRASNKNRNTNRVPDAWEAGAIATLESSVAAGQAPPQEA